MPTLIVRELVTVTDTDTDADFNVLELYIDRECFRNARYLGLNNHMDNQERFRQLFLTILSVHEVKGALALPS